MSHERKQDAKKRSLRVAANEVPTQFSDGTMQIYSRMSSVHSDVNHCLPTLDLFDSALRRKTDDKRPSEDASC